MVREFTGSIRTSYSRMHHVDLPSETTQPNRLHCSICQFPGVDIETVPAERLGLKAATTTGSTYVWTAANDPISNINKAVLVLETSGVCPFCFGERFLDGQKGSGNAIP